jgi:hypothetical protein
VISLSSPFHSEKPSVKLVLTKKKKKDPEMKKVTGETDPVDVMNKLREMKNSFK